LVVTSASLDCSRRTAIANKVAYVVIQLAMSGSRRVSVVLSLAAVFPT